MGKTLAVSSKTQVDQVHVYATAHYSIPDEALCGALAVSRSSYRYGLCRPVNQCKLAFKEAVNTCYIAHKARAGAPSITC